MTLDRISTFEEHYKYLVVLALGDRDVKVGRGAGNLFVLLLSEDVDASDVGLGTTVLAGLSRGHVDDLAGVALKDDEAVLAERRDLRGDNVRRVIGHLST